MKKTMDVVLLQILIPFFLYPLVAIGIFTVVTKCFPQIRTSFAVSISNGNLTITDNFNQIIRPKMKQTIHFNRIDSQANNTLPHLYLDQTFTEFEKTKIVKAYNVLSKVVIDPEFKVCIDKYTTSVMYYQAISKPLSEQFIAPLTNSQGNMYISNYFANSTIGGNAFINIVRSNSDSFRININSKHYFSQSQNDTPGLVEAITHEAVHNLGYGHESIVYSQSIFSQFRGNGVYVSGWCASNIAQKYL
jgi:hypothetical protein